MKITEITKQEYEVGVINSIAQIHPKLRQDSKPSTFALTYQGTAHTLVKNCGFTLDKAKEIESGYHELYEVSDKYIADRLQQASKDGYVEIAFGLRLRTPLLKQVILGNSKTPYEAQAEGRTAGNALGQSYCMLNSRAGNEFLKKVRNHLKYRLHVRPIAQIHDSQYYFIKDDPELLTWVNTHLVQAVRWQELPEIKHDKVKIGGKLDIYYPTWNDTITIPNDATEQEIVNLCKEEAIKRKGK